MTAPAVGAVAETLERRRMLSVVGPNVNITRTPVYEAETTIAIDPTNPNRMFAASNISGSGMRAAYSTDAGATWTNRTMADGNDGLPVACCDPQSTWDRFGNLYLVYLKTQSPSQAVIAMSTNGGQTFSTLASFTASDQPSIAFGGHPTNAAQGSVWITYQLSGQLWAVGAPVSGLGVGNVGTFGAPQNTGQSGNFGDIAVGPQGQVAVTWQNPSGGQGPSTIFMSRDLDGIGAGGFGAVSTITATNVGGFDYIPAQANRSIDAEANFAYDLSNGPRRGRLYMSYTEEPVNESNDTDILLRYSDDHGGTWSAPVRVNDDATNRSQFFPEIAVDPTSGNVAISFYDSRNDNGVVGPGSRDTAVNNDAQFWAAVSTDGGLSFQPNVQVSAGASNSNAFSNPNDYGDYTDLDFYGGAFYPIWADNSTALGNNPSTTQPDLATARVLVTQPAGPRVASGTPAAVVARPINSVPLTFDRAMNPASFTVVDDVVSFTGPDGANLKPSITGVAWSAGNTVLTLNLSTQLSTLGSYQLVVGPQILAATGGAPMDQDSDGVAGEAVQDRYTLPFQLAAPRVIGTSPVNGGTRVDAISQIDFDFNTPMNPASFSIADDVVSFTGPGGSNLKSAVTGVTWLPGDTKLRLTITPQSTVGPYRLVLGSQITAAGAGGFSLNSDNDATAGEPVDDRYTLNVKIDNAIGPDAFGYRAALSSYQAIDLVPGGAGVVTLLDNVDDGTASIPLGTSAFRFYGTTYTGANQLFVSSNGLITFGTANSDFENTDMTTSPSQAAIAPLWDDWQLNTGTTDMLLYRFDDLNADGTPDRLVIEWNEVPHYRPTGPTGPGTFQAILMLNTGSAPGDIYFNYVDVDFSSARASLGASASVGIKAAGAQGGNRLLISENSDASAFINNNGAVRITTADIRQPQPTGGEFLFAQSPHKVTVTFDEPVAPATLAASDLVVVRTDGGTTPPQPVGVTYDAGTRTATFAFASVLTDGNYRATLTAGSVADAAGNVTPFAQRVDFYVLQGDFNRDRAADFADLGILLNNYNTTGKTFGHGDANYDGAVDFADLGILLNNYNRTLPASPEPTATSTGTLITDGTTTKKKPKPTKTPGPTAPTVTLVDDAEFTKKKAPVKTPVPVPAAPRAVAAR